MSKFANCNTDKAAEEATEEFLSTKSRKTQISNKNFIRFDIYLIRQLSWQHLVYFHFSSLEFSIFDSSGAKMTLWSLKKGPKVALSLPEAQKHCRIHFFFKFRKNPPKMRPKFFKISVSDLTFVFCFSFCCVIIYRAPFALSPFVPTCRETN
jgi:hypothetical protein